MDLSQRMGFCPISTLFFENFVSVSAPLIKGWADVVFDLISFDLISAGVLFEHVFSLLISLAEKQIFAATIRNDLNTNVSWFMITVIQRNYLSSKTDLCHRSTCNCNDMQTLRLDFPCFFSIHPRVFSTLPW